MLRILLVSLAVLVFAACNKSDPPPAMSVRRPNDAQATATAAAPPAKSGGQPATEEGLRAAAKAQAEAWYSGNSSDAYASFSDECRANVSASEFHATVAAGRAVFEGLTGHKLSELHATTIDVRNFTATRAEVQVTGTIEGSTIYSQADWTTYAYQSGRWVETNCADMKISQ